MRKSTVIRLLGFLALVAGMVAFAVLLPVKAPLARFLTWSQGLGSWTPVLVAAMYIPAALFFVPGSLLSLGAGFVCGIPRGTVAVSLGSVTGASTAFFVGRGLARSWIESKVAKNEKFRAVDQALAKEGFRIVLLARLSPILPFNVLNYAFGATRVSFRAFFFGSWIGMLPGTFMYVYLGSAVKDLADILTGKVQGGVGQKILFGAGLLATVIVTIFVTHVARRALREVAPEVPQSQGVADPP
jgi:uncharacterized membrane protein YdjX (TVP38/TMEM64 family)